MSVVPFVLWYYTYYTMLLFNEVVKNNNYSNPNPIMNYVINKILITAKLKDTLP